MKVELAPGHYVVAVSGGVDSVVLLDMLAGQPELELVVAHFDHGIRKDSADDARFVEELAATHRLPFETKREELSAQASEELARQRRYAFLREVAAEHQARIITAHHADDVVETIAINLSRGTGWRGLAVLDSDIVRPLLGFTKQEIRAYAEAHSLHWHEDSTNASDAYLRNRLRRRLADVSKDQQWQLRALRDEQVALKRAIDNETLRLMGDARAYSRYLLTSVDAMTADELFRALCQRELGVAPTRPQRTRALLAIKTGRPGTVHHVATDTTLTLKKTTFGIKSSRFS